MEDISIRDNNHRKARALTKLDMHMQSLQKLQTSEADHDSRHTEKEAGGSKRKHHHTCFKTGRETTRWIRTTQNRSSARAHEKSVAKKRGRREHKQTEAECSAQVQVRGVKRYNSQMRRGRNTLETAADLQRVEVFNSSFEGKEAVATLMRVSKWRWLATVSATARLVFFLPFALDQVLIFGRFVKAL